MKQTLLEKIPVGKLNLSKAEIYEIIEKVAKNHRGKHFDVYDAEDIEHEVWLICFGALPKFNTDKSKGSDQKRALENWLNSCVSNRLINFHRDKFVGKPKVFKSERGAKLHQQKFNLAYPLTIAEIPESCFEQIIDFAVRDEEECLLGDLTEDLLEILDSYLSGEILKPYYKNKLFKAVKELLDQRAKDTDGEES